MAEGFLRATSEIWGFTPAAARLNVARRSLRLRFALIFWTCAKETPADCFLNKRQRFLGFTRFRLGCLRTELHRRRLIFRSFDTGLSLH